MLFNPLILLYSTTVKTLSKLPHFKIYFTRICLIRGFPCFNDLLSILPSFKCGYRENKHSLFIHLWLISFALLTTCKVCFYIVFPHFSIWTNKSLFSYVVNNFLAVFWIQFVVLISLSRYMTIKAGNYGLLKNEIEMIIDNENEIPPLIFQKND